MSDWGLAVSANHHVGDIGSGVITTLPTWASQPTEDHQRDGKVCPLSELERLQASALLDLSSAILIDMEVRYINTIIY